MAETAKCEICGEPMPQGETMFKFHGYSGPCPKPPLLQPHQRRVVTEKKELDEKLTKLHEFFGTETFSELDDAEIERLQLQAKIMGEYSLVLGARIAAFGG